MSEKKLTVRDIVTVAIMIALFFAILIVIGMGTVTMPILYLYGTAGIEIAFPIFKSFNWLSIVLSSFSVQ